MHKMIFYCQRTTEGLIHVTNVLMGCTGQHHVHTDAEFKQWSEGIAESSINWEVLKECDPCTCKLQPGETKP